MIPDITIIRIFFKVMPPADIIRYIKPIQTIARRVIPIFTLSFISICEFSKKKTNLKLIINKIPVLSVVIS